jgi:hypothetical protein
MDVAAAGFYQWRHAFCIFSAFLFLRGLHAMGQGMKREECVPFCFFFYLYRFWQGQCISVWLSHGIDIVTCIILLLFSWAWVGVRER